MKDKHKHMWVWRVKERPCPNCNRKGLIHEYGKEVRCQKCKGTGVVKYHYEICEICGVGIEDYYGQRKYK